MSDQREQIPPPQQPLPPGGRLPELNLAGNGGFNVASGQSIQYMPDPVTPVPFTPTLHGSTDLLGVNPDTPMPQLNLAGVEGVPSPAQLVRTEDLGIHLPDFTLPQSAQPELQTGDLLAPGVPLTQPGEFEPDPQLPDLNAYQHPYGVDIYNALAEAAALLLPEPFLGHMLVYEIVNGVVVNQNPLAADPLLPDLQQPAPPLEVQVQERPGDLASGAIEQMHMQPLYQQLANVPYGEVFMDQSGTNSAQRRHNDLLMGGLDAVEKREE